MTHEYDAFIAERQYLTNPHSFNPCHSGVFEVFCALKLAKLEKQDSTFGILPNNGHSK